MTGNFAKLALIIACLSLVATGYAAAESEDKIGYLSEKLKDTSSFKVRLKAAVLMGRLADPRAVVPLIKALRDDNYVVRGAAARGLGNLGHPMAAGSVESLLKLLDDEETFVRKEAEQALFRLAGARSMDTFISALSHRKPVVRLAAVHVLAMSSLPEARSALAQALGDEDEEVRAEAIVSVKGLGRAEMESLIQDALANGGNYRVQAAAARLVGEIKLASLLGPVADLLVSDEVVPEVKKEAAVTIKSLREQLDLPGLIEQLAAEERSVQNRAIALLGLHGGRDAVDALLELLRRDDIYLRHRAVFAIGDANDARAIPALEFLLKTETDTRARQSIERVLRKLRP